MLKVNLYKNKVAGSESYGKVYCRVETKDPKTIDDLAAHMASHNTVFSEGVIAGFLKDMAKCIREMLLDGESVKIDNLVIFTPSLKAKAADSVDAFDLNTNVKYVKCTARCTGNLMRAALTRDAHLGFTSLAQRVKAGELILSSTKGEYIEGTGTGTSGEPTVNP